MSEVLEFLVSGIGIDGFLILAAAVVLIFGSGRKRKVLGVLFLVAAMPVTPRIASLPLDASTIDAKSVGRDTPGEAFVAFGAGVFADDLGAMWPTAESLQRAGVAKSLAQDLGRPLIVSGGVVKPGLGAEAAVLADILRLPEDAILEAEARNTAENAEKVSALMEQHGIRSVVLVTGALHTRRSLAALKTIGVEVPTVIGVSQRKRLGLKHFLPSVGGLAAWKPVMHEYVGICWYVLNGWISPGKIFGD